MDNILYEQAKKGELGHAYIIDSDNDDLVNEIVLLIKAHPSEQYYFDDGKVETIRKIKQNLLLKPLLGERKVVIIRKSELLSLPAQNSLLKILEEPPSYATILLFSFKEDLLLSTIRSRCQLIKVNNITKKYNFDSVDEIKKMDLAQRFKFAEKVAVNEDIDSLLDNWLNYYHRKMLDEENVDIVIGKILIAKKRVGSNMNKKLMLENILLDF